MHWPMIHQNRIAALKPDKALYFATLASVVR